MSLFAFARDLPSPSRQIKSDTKPLTMPELDLPAHIAAAGLTIDQVDPDYLFFLQHICSHGNSVVLELPANGDFPARTVKYDEPPNDESQSVSIPTPYREEPPDGEAQSAPVPSPGRAKSYPRMEEEKPPADSIASIDEDYRVFLEHTHMENDRLVLEVEGHAVYYEAGKAQPGSHSKATGQEEEEVSAFTASGEVGAEEDAKVSVISSESDGPSLNVSEPPVCDNREHEQKVGKDVAGKDEEKYVAMKDDEAGLVAGSKPDVSDRHVDHVHVSTIEVNKDENLFNKPAMETLSTVNKEMNSSNGHDAEPHIASGLHGVIWPTHIFERPDSEFKERLMHILSKSFDKGEYDMLVGSASLRKPITKERRTRSGVKYYYCTHVKNKSYFDCYPDLAKQVEDTSYPNGLALLRGLFFWLKNVGHEDQFRPWRDDFTHYQVIPSMD